MHSLHKSLQEFCWLREQKRESKQYQNWVDIPRNECFPKITFELKISHSESLFIEPPGTVPWTFMHLYSVSEQTDTYFVY